MKRDPVILNELQAIAPGLVQAGAEQPQSLPEGYFDILPSVILSRIREEQDVPAGYFDGLASRIMGRIAEVRREAGDDELGQLAPTLAGMDRKMPYSLPEGYFNDLADHIVAGQHKPARIISMGLRRVVRYAAAAVVTGLLLTGAWFMIRDDRSATTPGQLAQAEKSADTLPETALANFLDETRSLDELDPATEENVKVEDMALLNLDDQKLGEILTTMTDKELADYVNSDPNGGMNVMKN